MDSPPEILLIEDNPDESHLFVRAVTDSRLNAVVTVAENAAQAVLRLNRIGPHADQPLPALVILDLSLPGLQGKTLLQVIRNAFGPRSVPVVVFTGSQAERDRVDCEALGISAYVIKPRKYADLVRFVGTLSRFVPDGSTSERLAAIYRRPGAATPPP
jgi:DNA-binding response OmpR family regulator